MICYGSLSQAMDGKITSYSVPQDVCCITTPLGKGDAALSRCIPLADGLDQGINFLQPYKRINSEPVSMETL